MKYLVKLLIFCGLLIGSVGCANSNAANKVASNHLKVATTVSPITNIIYNIGGSQIDLTGIIPEGTDSHTFEPAPSDAKTLSQADVIFVNGCIWKIQRSNSLRQTSNRAPKLSSSVH